MNHSHVKTRLLPLLVVFSACLLAALTTGSPVFLCVALLLLFVCLAAGFSLWQALKTAEVQYRLSDNAVERGARIQLNIGVSHGGLIPIAPVVLSLRATPDLPVTQVRLRETGRRMQQVAFPFVATHIGICQPGVASCEMSDVFGIFTVQCQPKSKPAELMVLPLAFETEDLSFSAGDQGFDAMARATEDTANPADVRAYKTGDSMKKIHWKLSARKRELMVRRFEEPALPDALILMDCSQPTGSPDQAAYLRDTLLETAASVVKHQINGDNPVRMPILGTYPMEYEKSMGLPVLLEELARIDFSQTEKFERVLLLETRRMRRTGATVVITTRLNSTVTEMVVRIRRMGPFVRLYLITMTPDSEQLAPLIARLQHNKIEVCYVTPSLAAPGA